MKALIQRVVRGKVCISGKVTGETGRGYVILLGVKNGDTPDDARYLANKTINLRIFPDSKERMNFSIQDIEGEIMVISQFTLYADTKKGNRPSFVKSATPETAERLYEIYVNSLRSIIGDSRISTGIFRANMIVEIINDGPVTIEISSDKRL